MSGPNGTDPEQPTPVGSGGPQLSGGEGPSPDGGKGTGRPAGPAGQRGGPGGHGATTGRPVGRRRSRLRDLPLIGWLAAAVVIAVAHRWLPDANWLMLHLVLLGALTHAIVVWSFHFAQTLLRSPASEVEAARHNRRLGLLTLGAAAVLIGVPTTWWPLTLVGGILVAAASAGTDWCCGACCAGRCRPGSG